MVLWSHILSDGILKDVEQIDGLTKPSPIMELGSNILLDGILKDAKKIQVLFDPTSRIVL